MKKGWFITDLKWKSSGYGPRAGFDVSREIGEGFSLFTNTGISLLRSEAKFTDLDTATNNRQEQAITPHIDMRIGAMYTYAMDQGDLTIRGGYQVNEFINSGALMTNGANGINSSLNRNLGFEGWFIGLHWMGNT